MCIIIIIYAKDIFFIRAFMFIKRQESNCSKLTGSHHQFQNRPNLQRRTRNSPLRIGSEGIPRGRTFCDFCRRKPRTFENLSCSHVVKLGVWLCLKISVVMTPRPSSTYTLGVHTSLRPLGGTRASRARSARRRSAASKTISLSRRLFNPPHEG